MNAIDDDDDFLYGGGAPEPASSEVHQPAPDSGNEEQDKDTKDPAEEEDDGEEDMDEEESGDESDIEIITDGPIVPTTKNSLDFRPRQPPTNRSTQQPSAPHSTLTTEYKPLERDSSTTKQSLPPILPRQPTTQTPAPVPVNEYPDEPMVDPNTLPPVKAPVSAPKIELDKDGLMDGRSIYEVDIAALENKAWRRPGADLSDWFNYGFDEISWEAYAARRRDLGEMAPVLKANVLNFSGMSEEQVLNMPSDLRGMVMMSAHVAASNAGANQGPNMMQNSGGGGMHPEMMMNMGMMGKMPGGMGQGAPGEMGGPGQQMMMHNMEGDGSMQAMDYQGGAMNMGGDFMQEPNSMNPATPVSAGSGGYPMEGVPGGPARGTGFRGRVQPVAPRGRGTPPIRGRGRGFEIAPPTGPRAASPLPPNVPTGPRNQHRYKDRDTGAPSTEPLDYGADAGSKSSDRTTRDEFGRDIDRSSKDRDDDSSKSGRKRRGSPPDDTGRSKRR
ncbi:cleavage polyadenylation factor subunit fip1 [Serendipita sp. 401]|nr:cleavage polyadenylation factor subunit fip1 [Serendipita sp. 401]KAG8868070.1 cleavage polyadenylation factor subunit fip1 [Serendipita sp. 405]KAG9053977.1 cleavage polyadenylation factor subunit fip1 [Serendipita sp. 407]